MKPWRVAKMKCRKAYSATRKKTNKSTKMRSQLKNHSKSLPKKRKVRSRSESPKDALADRLSPI